MVQAQTPVSKTVRNARPGWALEEGDAFLLVDVQRDFLPDGPMAVQGGDAVVPPANACINRFVAHGLPVYATRDWHPAGHCSFKAMGGPWPAHCVAGSQGAEFAPALRLPRTMTIVPKGRDAGHEAYSAFRGTDLHSRLQELGVVRLFVAGLATDYCVLESVLDALGLGYKVVVVSDAVAAVDVKPGDGKRAIARMLAEGAQMAASDRLV